MCEATTSAVVCNTLGLIDKYHCRDRTIMVFTKADGMALASQWHKLFSKFHGSEPGGKLVSFATFFLRMYVSMSVMNPSRIDKDTHCIWCTPGSYPCTSLLSNILIMSENYVSCMQSIVASQASCPKQPNILPVNQSINQSINFIVCLETYAQIHQTIYTFSAEWKTSHSWHSCKKCACLCTFIITWMDKE